MSNNKQDLLDIAAKAEQDLNSTALQGENKNASDSGTLPLTPPPSSYTYMHTNLSPQPTNPESTKASPTSFQAAQPSMARTPAAAETTEISQSPRVVAYRREQED